MSESGYAKITSHEATLRLWAKTLETMQPKAGKMLTLRIEARPFNEEDEDAEDLYDFTLRADGELHDGHSTLAEVARSYPDVSPSIEAWKAGRTVPFAVMLTAARKLAGLAEPLPEEAA